MANLTITVDANVLKRARMRAIDRGESVNQYLAEQLAIYADADAARERKQRAAEQFVQLSDNLSSANGARWTREQLYDARRVGIDQSNTSQSKTDA